MKGTKIIYIRGWFYCNCHDGLKRPTMSDGLLRLSLEQNHQYFQCPTCKVRYYVRCETPAAHALPPMMEEEAVIAALYDEEHKENA